MLRQWTLVIALTLLPVVSSVAMAQYPKFEVVVEQVRENPSKAGEALRLLRATVEQRPDDAAAQGAKMGLDHNGLRSSTYTSREARAAALYSIGQLRSPEAMAYLEGRSGTDFALEERAELWSAARIGLYAARLVEIENLTERTKFLEDIVTANDHDAFVRSRVRFWAAEQLCNSGILASLPVVQAFLFESDPRRAQEHSRFCELRMLTIASDPDSITAIGSALQVTDRLPDPKLMQWAIWQLSDMDDPRAIEPLQRYEREILALPQASPLRAPLLDYANEIRRLNSSRLAPVPHDPSRGYVIE